MKHFISLGAGVQSSTMALMAAHGEIAPMPDGAIFADTQNEPKRVYEWLDWLEKRLPFPVFRVTRGNLMREAVRLRLSRKSGNTYLAIGIPAYLTVGDGGKGIMKRQCSRTFKIDMINRKARELREQQPVTTWIGISRDEAHRMKPARVKWCTNIWPLIDLGMTRNDCLAWMKRMNYPEPPRSACINCPYHSDAEWLLMKTRYPEDFLAAVLFEQQLKDAYSKAGAIQKQVIPYLHDSRQPLVQVDFSPNRDQPNLFGNECEGVCGN
jgi:hypothetical protein